MKKLWKKITGITMALAMLLTIMPMRASAEVYVPKTQNVIMYHAKDYAFDGKTSKNRTVLCSISRSDGTVTSLKSSKPGVLKVMKKTEKYGTYTYDVIYIRGKKAGTSTVSFKVNGKTYKTKVTVKRYENPIASVSIGDTVLSAETFDTRSTHILKYKQFKNKNVKVKINMADGWKLQEMPIQSGSTWVMKEGYGYWQKGWAKADAKANGKSVKVKGNVFSICITAVNEKSGVTEDVWIIFK